ncbi:MAG: Lon protease family protein [Planctomycetota bacterium]|jgi:ATP-dependent Lon protease
MIDPLPADQLRWHCDPDSLPFESTAEVESLPGVVGQDSAVAALKFGLEVDAPGQNIFVRGLTGTGRMRLVRRMLEELKPTCDVKQDRCYVHNFSEPDRPRLISLPAGRARAFRRRMHDFSEFLRDQLPEALNADSIKARRESLDRMGTERIKKVTDPFEAALKEAGLALVSIQLGALAQTAIFPVVDGKPVPPEEYENLKAEGKITESEDAELERSREKFQRELESITDEVRKIRRRTAQGIHSINEGTARALMHEAASEILSEFPGEDVQKFLSEVVDDVAENRLGPQADGEVFDPVRAYGVNILHENEEDEACPIVVENTPTLNNLLGTIDREWTPRGPMLSDYSMIRGGSLLTADGGYLVLEARDVLGEPAAWKYLMRTLRTGELEIVPAEFGAFYMAPSLKPEPVPIKVRVILIGDAQLYYLLDSYDDDFRNLFKVLADFQTEIPRDPDGIRQYAGAIARMANEERFPHFHKTAVAALLEHGARIAANQGKVTTRASRIVDIGEEAAFLATKEGADLVRGEHVIQAVERTKQRADLRSRRFRELLHEGTIRVQTDGEMVGQINGLAVIHAGMLTYGFPARITASIGAGSAGIINIEGQAALSGAIHTKGFHILGGLLRHLLKMDHPLAFSASLAFEQSYGTIDGDSASCAETCCLLSALTGVPIKQNLAITGAIDQVGHVQAIGGVNEKIEGFYDTCVDLGLTGDQGVIIPTANAKDLMLRRDVVAACKEGKFRVWAVERVSEALEILTGREAGTPDSEGHYPEDSLLGIAVAKATEYWIMSLQNPGTYFIEEAEEETEEPDANPT